MSYPTDTPAIKSLDTEVAVVDRAAKNNLAIVLADHREILNITVIEIIFFKVQ